MIKAKQDVAKKKKKKRFFGIHPLFPNILPSLGLPPVSHTGKARTLYVPVPVMGTFPYFCRVGGDDTLL